jgi:hypothetical protein
VDCTPGDASWEETTTGDPNDSLVHNVACMAPLGKDGCGFEQQLKAGVRALTRDDQTSFIRDQHLLAVIIVSDEEDCSIKDPGLFSTPEWNPTSTINTACNYPAENEENFLFSTDYFYEQLLAVKNGRRSEVVFAAIAGVPTGADSPCQGTGDSLDGCLADPRMELVPQEFTEPQKYIHFRPACTRSVGDVTVTEARPGRRYVALAQKFGCTGYVYSICNEDWSNAMTEIARLIVRCIHIV